MKTHATPPLPQVGGHFCNGRLGRLLANTMGWRRVFLCLLLVKMVYLGGVYLALRRWPDMDEEKYFDVMRHWPMEESPVFASHFGTWDGAHYLYLSTVGYTAGANSCAFYPLWPLVIRWFSVLTGGSYLITGMVLANLFSLGAWVVFHQLAAKRFGAAVAWWALVFLIIFPGSLFYQFIYSEPLFFLLLMLLWSGVEQGRYRLAWIAAFLLPLSRAVGVFIVLPIGWHLLVDQRWRWLCRWRWLDVEQERLRSGGSVGAHWQGYALMAAPLLGLALYFVSMWRWTGNPFEGIEAQGFWGTHSIGHLWNVPKFIVGFFGPTRWHGYSGSVLDRCAFMLLVYCLPLIWRMGKDLVVWTYVLGILPAMSGTLTSFTRYESTTFPLFIALSIFFVGMKKKWPLIVFLVLSAIIHGTLLWRFVNFRWAG